MSGWKPIETAPCDGTPLLARCGWTVSTCWIVERPEKRTTRKVGIWPFRKSVEDIEPAALYLEHVTDGGNVNYVTSNRLALPPSHWRPMLPGPRK